MYGPGNLYSLYSYVFILQCFVQNLIGNKSVWFGLCSTERKIIIYQNLGLLAVVIKNRLDTDPQLLWSWHCRISAVSSSSGFPRKRGDGGDRYNRIICLIGRAVTVMNHCIASAFVPLGSARSVGK